MKRFVCLYAGETRESARLVAMVDDFRTVLTTAKAALRALSPGDDPVIRSLQAGRREALRQIIAEGENK